MNIDKRYIFILYGTVKRKSYYNDWWLIAPHNKVRANSDFNDIVDTDNGYYLEMRCPDRVKRWIKEYDWKHNKDNVVNVYDLMDCPPDAFEKIKHPMVTLEEYNLLKKK